MSTPVLTFFSNKGGVGKTSLTFNLAWMLSELGHRVVAIDLDHQASLTSAFLPERALAQLWADDDSTQQGATVYRCVQPLLEGGEIRPPRLQEFSPRLALLPGDLALASIDGDLSDAWSASAGPGDPHRPFRSLTALWYVAQMAAVQHEADLVLFDTGPNSGALNRSALIASDHVVIPLATDSLSLQSLKTSGEALGRWRTAWADRKAHWTSPDFALPVGAMKPIGYVLMQHLQRLSRPEPAEQPWADRIAIAYRENLALGTSPEHDDCLGQIKHYRGLFDMAAEAHKPMFHLSSADGAMGVHLQAVQDAGRAFRSLARMLEERGAFSV